MWQRGIIRLISGAEGSVAIISALALLGLVGVASLAVDMGHLYTVRNEMQNTADAAALAAAGNLIVDQGGVAVRDSYGAHQAAMSVAQRQSQLQGLPEVGQGDRNDLTVIFGEWNLYSGNPDTAWTEIGTTCGSYSNANAVRVSLQRASGMTYGPVTNIFAPIMGIKTAEVRATATAYLGYTNEVQTGTVQVPLALPSNVLTASKGRSGWFAGLIGPREAMASTTKTYVFKDTGGCNVNNTVDNNPTLDSNQAYLFTAAADDQVPDTIKDTLEKIYNPSKTGSPHVPVLVADLKVGQAIYPRSEFKYGSSYIAPIFHNLQTAYNTKKSPSTHIWRTTLAVYGMQVASLPRKGGVMSLVRLLVPFWPSEAFACYTVPPPQPVVTNFVNVDITGVTYSSSGDEGSYTFPKTINHVRYTSKKDFLTRHPSSVWNVNSVTIENVTDGSTVSPPGSVSGGPSTDKVNHGAPTNVGALATIPKLVK